MIDHITTLLGKNAEDLLNHTCIFPRDTLHLPGPDFVERILLPSDRPIPVLRNMQLLFGSGRLARTGYLSILPVDQGIEHSAGASFAPNPLYFDPENIVRLAMEGGCSAVASTLGVLGSIARKYAHRIPFIVKINHNDLLVYPAKYDQILFAGVHQAFDMGAAAIGATIYYGSEESSRQIQEISEAFALAHELGLVTVLWAYLRNSGFKKDGVDYSTAADLTGQANHLAATIQADIVKQKQPDVNGGYTAVNFGKTSARVYDRLSTPHPIDLTRYQVMNCYLGRAGLINSGGASEGENDWPRRCVQQLSISGRRHGPHLGPEGLPAPHVRGCPHPPGHQDVYLCPEVTVA
jgi:class I fructose-bisphosphate aldolase